MHTQTQAAPDANRGTSQPCLAQNNRKRCNLLRISERRLEIVEQRYKAEVVFAAERKSTKTSEHIRQHKKQALCPKSNIPSCMTSKSRNVRNRGLSLRDVSSDTNYEDSNSLRIISVILHGFGILKISGKEDITQDCLVVSNMVGSEAKLLGIIIEQQPVCLVPYSIPFLAS